MKRQKTREELLIKSSLSRHLQPGAHFLLKMKAIKTGAKYLGTGRKNESEIEGEFSPGGE